MMLTTEQFQTETLRIADEIEKLIRDYFETKMETRIESHGDDALYAFAIGAVTAVLPIVLALGLTRDHIIKLLDDQIKALIQTGLIPKP